MHDRISLALLCGGQALTGVAGAGVVGAHGPGGAEEIVGAVVTMLIPGFGIWVAVPAMHVACFGCCTPFHARVSRLAERGGVGRTAPALKSRTTPALPPGRGNQVLVVP